MSTVAANAIQTAVYGVLTADVTMQTLTGGRIYWDVPNSTSWPYYAMGETSAANADTFGKTVYDINLQHHVYDHRDNSESPTNVQAIMTRALQLLDRQSLTISGLTHLMTVRELDQIVRDDSDVWHGVLHFKIMAQVA